MQTPSMPDPGICPVAVLADEAASLATAWRIISAAYADGEPSRRLSLADAFAVPPEGVAVAGLFSAVDVQREIVPRLDAIARLAPHRQAISLKGAAFQVLLISRQAETLLACEFSGQSADVALTVARTLDRCAVSILADLASVGAALPDDLLDYFGQGSGDQPSRAVQLVLDLPAVA